MNNRLTKWVIEKIKKEYCDDIALLISIKGHSTNGDNHGECFDYFIPCTPRGEELSRAFIIEGIGHDLYARDWDRIERSATLDEMTLVLANATILYARTPEDEERFYAIRDKLYKNLADPVFTYRKAVERIEKAKINYTDLCFEKKFYRIRHAAAEILSYLTEAVAFVNGTFADNPIFSEIQAYDACPESRIYSCPDMTEVPDHFFAYARKLLSTTDGNESKALTQKLIETTCDFLDHQKPTSKAAETGLVDWTEFAGWYQEMSLTWNRIRYYCDHGMMEQAYVDANNLQGELIWISQDFGVPEYNLLDSYDPDRLELLRYRADRIESEIRDIILDHGVKIDEFDTFEEFFADEGWENL
ncbi:MAG: hypothetical protein II312_13800 [Lachnospiraceae bacterium]|nr:hypothetical protein [Lachnospiraceae bacterium]MEE0918458.1 hypothetical protein [Lachnospiraceae bacterium]